MIGHEITAIYGLDHAETLAVVFPSMLEIMKSDKKKKLLQYGRKVWGVDQTLPEDEQVSLAIAETKKFFQRMGLKTSFTQHGLNEDVIEKIANSLEDHGLIKLGEKGAVTPHTVRQVLQLSI